MSRSPDIVHPWIPRKDGSMVIVIPKALRKELNIEVGDTFIVKSDNNKLIYRKVSPYKEKL